MTRISRILLLLVMMTAGAMEVWGQTDYSGTYFLAMPGTGSYNAQTPENNFYLVPTEGWCYYKATNNVQADDNGQPFLTTYKCGGDQKAKWTIQKHETENYYYIIHVEDGKYVTYNGQLSGAGANRARVHLEASITGDNNLFSITKDNAGRYFISNKNDAGQYLNVTDGNKSAYTGQSGKTDGPTGYKNVGGIIGRWNEANNTSQFYFEPTTSIDRPTITNNFDGTFTIEAAAGAIIYYTTDGTTPTTSTPTSGTTSVNITVDPNSDVQTIRAIAKMPIESVTTTERAYTLPICGKPVIKIEGTQFTITAPAPGASIYYTTDYTEANPSATHYTGPFSMEGVTAVRAIATMPGYHWSEEAYRFPATRVSSSNQMTDMNRDYILNSDFVSVSSVGTSEAPFKGKIDGELVTLSGLTHPLIGVAEDAVIKNVILDNVSISSGTNVGAICGEAKGDTRIYNCGVLATNSTVEKDNKGYDKITSCSSTVSGSEYVGGIVGLLDGSSRVINCFSYANITGGSYVGGIVGYNNVATTATNLKTMVMNCMFYGDITGGSDKAPIYNGKNISNVGATGVSNFNYFRAEASYVENKNIQTYNCALLAETRYLQRFEFFRHLLNGHRELAAWWATDNANNKDEMMKWVLEPSQIGSTTPYPILKTPGKYPSVVNIDAANATTQTERNKGGLLGTLTVNIQMGSGGAKFGPPSGADILLSSSSQTLNITDKDPDHFNFNYGKVQLPYYNDVGTGNYTGHRVVTGWKIVSITGGTAGSFTTGTDATVIENENNDVITLTTPYNFADRHCTNKDKYSVSGRIFNQGAYWDVPEGVTGITIEPYWAQAVYCADSYRDVVYDKDMGTPSYIETVGGGHLFNSGELKDINGSNQYVYDTMDGAQGALTIQGGVYDNAIVLVGNVHQNGLSSDDVDKPYTIMSIDLDHDNEPDYSYILRFDGRCESHPVRVDFLNIPGLGMAQKSTGGTGTYNFGIMIPKGWFESTNTSLFRFTQFEYEHSKRTVNDPLILQGGVMEQWVSFNQKGISHNTPYFHVGGNVWFKEFHRGTHQDRTQNTSHPPISVTGGDFDEFYLTGLYTANVASYADNAECYINGGRFGTVAGAAMEGIAKAGGADEYDTGNITWQIQNADINEFYGGGLNAVHPVEGNITTIIEGGYIKQFCGGPKFGDMSSGKKVITTATNCKFDTFFGAGYGGNSYSRFTPNNINNINGDYSGWNTFLTNNYKQEYNSTYGGVSVTYTTQYIPMSNNYQNVARLLIDFVSFSLATTHKVTSKLTGCTITNNFYGGGRLGKVDGPVSSTLTNCTVKGNVFGAGYSASKPTVDVINTGNFVKAPFYDGALGVYFDPTLPESVEYTWENRKETVNSTARAIDKTKHILYTNVDLDKSNLGSVNGKVTLTITTSGENGISTIGTDGDSATGHVYGGGDESAVNNTDNPTTASTIVTIKGNTTVNGNVFGGGNRGIVSGTTTVNIIEE